MIVFGCFSLKICSSKAGFLRKICLLYFLESVRKILYQLLDFRWNLTHSYPFSSSIYFNYVKSENIIILCYFQLPFFSLYEKLKYNHIPFSLIFSLYANLLELVQFYFYQIFPIAKIYSEI